MSNPFEAPLTPADGPPGGVPGGFDIGRAYADAWEATKRNWLVWLAVTIVSFLVLSGSLVACVLPAVAVWPVVFWGTTRVTLDMLDRNGDVATVFAGFSRFGAVWGPMLVLGLGLLVLSAPGFIPPIVLQLIATETTDEGSITALLLSLLGQGISSAWSIVVMSRFLPAVYLVVEGDRSATDAIGEAWQITSGSWGQLILFQLSLIVVSFVGLLACCVGIIPAMMISGFAQASVYRQLIGR